MWTARRGGWLREKGASSRGGSLVEMVFFLAMVSVVPWELVSWAGDSEFPGSGDAVETSALLPGGTVLPVALEKTISLKEAQAGQLIEAKITQEVPLPSGEKIPQKSSVKGSIVSVTKDEDGPGVKLILTFNHLETKKETLAVVTYLRAIASYNAVRAAQVPRSGADVGSPTGWADTTQIGGDTRFGDGGAVRGRGKENVGKGVRGGVLVYVKANPARGCDGPAGDDRPQALWVFSADACGVYDLKGVTIAHKGKGEPVGEITLQFEKVDMKLDGGTAMLLRIPAQP